MLFLIFYFPDHQMTRDDLGVGVGQDHQVVRYRCQYCDTY